MILRALLCLSLLLFVPFEIRASEVAGLAALFRQEMGKEIAKTLRRREGLVMWMDREAGETWQFGEGKLLHQAFLPGSWLKLIVAESAAGRGIDLQYHCRGHDKIDGKKRHCWTHRGHGELNLAQALGISCNLYFQKLGERLTYPVLRTALLQAGLASEERLPETPERLDPILLAIGDEPAFAVTPASAWAYWQALIARLDRPDLSALKQGLRRAVREGTARQVSNTELEILAKTGTGDSLQKLYPTNGWFLGAYPVGRPRWLLLVFLKEAHGFTEAANLAEEIYRLGNKLGVLK